MEQIICKRNTGGKNPVGSPGREDYDYALNAAQQITPVTMVVLEEATAANKPGVIITFESRILGRATKVQATTTLKLLEAAVRTLRVSVGPDA